MNRIFFISISFFFMIGCEEYDVVIRKGTIYDGYGFEPFIGDVAIKGDKVVLIKENISEKGRKFKVYKSRIKYAEINIKKPDPILKLTPNK